MHSKCQLKDLAFQASQSNMFGMSLAEITAIALIAIIFIGPKGLPKLGAKLGKFMRSYRGIKDDIQDQFKNNLYKTPEKTPKKTSEKTFEFENEKNENLENLENQVSNKPDH